MCIMKYVPASVPDDAYPNEANVKHNRVYFKISQFSGRWAAINPALFVALILYSTELSELRTTEASLSTSTHPRIDNSITPQ